MVVVVTRPTENHGQAQRVATISPSPALKLGLPGLTVLPLPRSSLSIILSKCSGERGCGGRGKECVIEYPTAITDLSEEVDERKPGVTHPLLGLSIQPLIILRIQVIVWDLLLQPKPYVESEERGRGEVEYRERGDIKTKPTPQ